MTRTEITDALYDWTNEDLENRASICIAVEGDMVTSVNRGYKDKLVKALIAVLSEELNLREEVELALKYIDAVDAKQLYSKQDNESRSKRAINN
ncbi:MAG: hypothetical protein SOW36_08225 [Porphyromonas sp.]|uniref:hypothetical protein n=1 Tax=Porphyromonas sp. TaxID=1924944 RepID=UPI002A750834|nr:hypothetical protein [Porphyromonas sp.]MDY3112607.1 hypothetical protein [Porphyromonas sp.]